jgi:hypothetical protein
MALASRNDVLCRVSGIASDNSSVIDPSFVRNVALTRVFAARAHLQLRNIDAA